MAHLADGDSEVRPAGLDQHVSSEVGLELTISHCFSSTFPAQWVTRTDAGFVFSGKTQTTIGWIRHCKPLAIPPRSGDLGSLYHGRS